ncbi:hypothetical protein MNEG_6720 [Monoraphidium neglectum]|uniref:Uncharacterized protein n=1 Tax=Monoraphidium neglectum TaxID=145388 RepID=A0A0D2ML09_9CHLO|nr:hypothetical protein MNEG_6720 [Monoraphidium neglectum]KIZ01242.1 hypothetical protein MNEG_6720 [Monoraphidium neglectum]|eukprot:XP_013900261.1 hypothetical protein MNEG_6720 [Monoraphidium neglectum]
MAAAKDASQAAADGVVSSQRLADAARWEAVAASVGTLPGLQGAGEAAAAALLAGAGSLGAVAAAGVDDLLLLCVELQQKVKDCQLRLDREAACNFEAKLELEMLKAIWYSRGAVEGLLAAGGGDAGAGAGAGAASRTPACGSLSAQRRGGGEEDAATQLSMHGRQAVALAQCGDPLSTAVSKLALDSSAASLGVLVFRPWAIDLMRIRLDSGEPTPGAPADAYDRVVADLHLTERQQAAFLALRRWWERNLAQINARRRELALEALKAPEDVALQSEVADDLEQAARM